MGLTRGKCCWGRAVPGCEGRPRQGVKAWGTVRNAPPRDACIPHGKTGLSPGYWDSIQLHVTVYPGGAQWWVIGSLLPTWETWHGPDQALAVVRIWGVSQLMGSLAFFLSTALSNMF